VRKAVQRAILHLVVHLGLFGSPTCIIYLHSPIHLSSSILAPFVCKI
jgi:hypothetical protein